MARANKNDVARQDVEVKTVLDDVRSFELSQGGKKALVRKGDTLYILDATPAPAVLTKKDVHLAGWRLSV